MKKLLGSLGIVAALGAGAFAISTVLPAGAQSTPSSSSSSTSSDSPAKGGGRGAAIKSALDGLVQNGTINEDQEKAVIDALKNVASSGGHGRFGPRVRLAGNVLKVAADKIGVQPKDLIEARRNGQSIADVANSKGVNPSDVVTAIVDAGNQKIDQAVANGHVQQDRADVLKAKLPQLADTVVNAKGPWHGPHDGNGPSNNSDSSSDSSDSSSS